MSSHDGLSHKFESISHLVPLPSDLSPDAPPTPEPIMEWAWQMIRQFLDGHGPREATTKDGLSIVNMALYFESPILFLTESYVLLFLHSCPPQPSFTKLICIEGRSPFLKSRYRPLRFASRPCPD
jgi:hypothetical protein